MNPLPAGAAGGLRKGDDARLIFAAEALRQGMAVLWPSRCESCKAVFKKQAWRFTDEGN